MLNIRNIALRISLQSEYSRKIVRGIINYMDKHGEWNIDFHEGEPISLTTWDQLQSWNGDGIIAFVRYQQEVEMLLSKGVPVVNLAEHAGDIPFPTVTFDSKKIGEMAAEHLLKRRLERYAFIGQEGVVFGYRRFLAFKAALARQGFDTRQLWLTDSRESPAADTGLMRIHDFNYVDMIKKLTPPVGVFAASDTIGFGVLHACRKLGLSVPDDICLLSSDNDNLLCSLAHPSLSSISTPCEQCGYEAAKILDRMMRGKPQKQQKITIPPDGIVLRNSSDRLAISDRYVAEVLRYIRNNAGRFIDVTNVMSVVPISRRSLERRFFETVGHGIYQEINRVHVEKAKKLLSGSDLLVTHIARESGFNSINRFQVVFQKYTGMSASEYRLKNKK